MVNDINTLNGALTELGETLATNLTSMGVSASASDGLTTLANKITSIAPSVGGITPTVSIDISKTPSTVYVGGNVLISAKVNADYDDESLTNVDLKGVLQGATVIFKNNGTILGTGITGSDGIATYTISNIQSGNYSITAHFDGTGTDYESATSSALTFTPINLLFYDACNSSSGLSNYGTPVGVGSTISTNYTSYNSTENAYDVRTNGDWGMIPITAMTGQDNYKISMLVKTRSNNGASRGGFGFLASDSTNVFPCWKIEGNGACNYTLKQGSSEPNTKVCDTPNAQRTWYKIELIKIGTSYTCNVYDSNDTLLGTHTTTVDLGSSVRCGLYRVGGSSYGAYVKEIRAEPI